jgi:hypothetical protein
VLTFIVIKLTFLKMSDSESPGLPDLAEWSPSLARACTQAGAHQPARRHSSGRITCAPQYPLLPRHPLQRQGRWEVAAQLQRSAAGETLKMSLRLN